MIDFDSIVYADQYMAVVVKRCGEVCENEHPASLSRRLRSLVESRLGHAVARCECVHRLDRPVSGLCVLGLTDEAVSRLSRCFSSGTVTVQSTVRKSYCAVTELRAGSELPDGAKNSPAVGSEGWTELECLMCFDQKRQKARIVSSAGRGGKPARLRYRIVGRGERYDFLLVEPLTGRSHQIRCQLAAEGRPIKGDVKYGARRSERCGGIRLHAWRLGLTHPFTGEPLTFTCPPPEMDNLWQAFWGFLRDEISADT